MGELGDRDGESLQATDAQELAMELLIEKVGSTHETDKDKAHYESLLTELAAAVKTAEYHVDGVQLANKKWPRHVL